MPSFENKMLDKTTPGVSQSTDFYKSLAGAYRKLVFFKGFVSKVGPLTFYLILNRILLVLCR